MTIGFDVWTWKDILKVCGSVVDDNEARIMLTHIQIKAEYGQFKAYGCNPAQVARLEGTCQMTDGAPVEILIRPVKTPAKTNRVTITANVNGAHIIVFYDKNNGVIATETQQIIEGEFIKVEDVAIKPTEDALAPLNHGEGCFMFAVDTKKLINALTGLKDSETVIFNFVGTNKPFMIRSYDEQTTKALEIVYPKRIFGGVN